MWNSLILTITTFFPLLGVLVLLFVDKSKLNAIKIIAFVVSLLNLIVSLSLYFNFSSETAGMQFSIKKIWIESLGMG
jgi:NADH:ubiquinone oxidoreductase subunit 4 (subunit M)